MDFFTVKSRIKHDPYKEEIYTHQDRKDWFEFDLTLAIKDSGGFNQEQSEYIFSQASSRDDLNLSDIVSKAEQLTFIIREIINLG